MTVGHSAPPRRARINDPPWRIEIARIHKNLNLWIAAFISVVATGAYVAWVFLLVSAHSTAMQLFSIVGMSATIFGAIQLIFQWPNVNQGANEVDELTQRVEEMYEHTLAIDPRPH